MLTIHLVFNSLRCENWKQPAISLSLLLQDYLDALKKRHDFFATMGCAVSDHGLEQIYAEDYTDAEIGSAF